MRKDEKIKTTPFDFTRKLQRRDYIEEESNKKLEARSKPWKREIQPRESSCQLNYMELKSFGLNDDERLSKTNVSSLEFSFL